MGFVDGLLILAIVGGAGWLLYRSVRKKGSCAGCSGCACGKDSPKGNNRPWRFS